MRIEGHKGFTLIELLLVVLIMAVVLAVVGACIAAGIRVWDEARSFQSSEMDALPALTIIEKDLRNTFRFRLIGFRGQESRMSFPGLVPTDEGLDMGTVVYVLDESKRYLKRRTWAFPPATEPNDPQEERLLSNVDDFSLTYFRWVVDAQGAFRWEDMGETVTNYPHRVDLRMLIDERKRGEALEIVRTVLLPVEVD